MDLCPGELHPLAGDSQNPHEQSSGQCQGVQHELRAVSGGLTRTHGSVRGFNTSAFVFQQDSNSRYSALSVQHQMLKVGDWDSTAPVELVMLGSGISAECQGVDSAFLLLIKDAFLQFFLVRLSSG